MRMAMEGRAIGTKPWRYHVHPRMRWAHVGGHTMPRALGREEQREVREGERERERREREKEQEERVKKLSTLCAHVADRGGG